MTEKREGQFGVSYPSKSWTNYPPEPWAIFDTGDGQTYEIDHAGNGSVDGFHDKGTASRIAACVNFCREFDTEFLEKHTLRYLAEQEASVAMALPLQPGFVGLIACFEKGSDE